MNTTITGEQSRLADGLQVFYRQSQGKNEQRFRVAAYCRVSTNMKLQESSLETQMASFRQRISQNPSWELVGIYADKGFTGTSAKQRVEFQRLIQDARDGKIDYIMAKSISRFARNTVDALSYTRELKAMGVGLYFEEQELDTLSASSEIFLTIHAAFAQEESFSFSENMKRGIRNRFAMGTPKWSETYGYRCDKDGNWHIHEEEAEVIREIYRYYVEGYSIKRICDELTARGIHPPKGSRTEHGKDVWWEQTVAWILHSEKYIGDAEMQKTYTADYLTRKRVVNRNAEVPKYYKEDHHERIIDDETHELARKIAIMRSHYTGSEQYPFYGFLKCPFCGGNMVRVQLMTRERAVAWFCMDKCKYYAVKEKYIHAAAMQAYERTGHAPPSAQVEYKFLLDNAERITFEKMGGKVNWHQLIVNWRWGEQTSGGMAYEKPSDIPCTTVETDQEGWNYLDGVPVNRYPHTAACVKRIFEYVKDVVVDKSGEIPIVKKPRNIKGKGKEQ